MKVEGQVSIQALPEIVWEIINDPNSMQNCMPGCTDLQELGSDRYRAMLELGVGAMRGSFEADLQLSGKVAPRGYRLEVSAQSFTGSVTGGGTVALSSQGAGTQLGYTGELHTTGMLAAFGQSFLSGVVEQLTAEFFAGLGRIAAARGATLGSTT